MLLQSAVISACKSECDCGEWQIYSVDRVREVSHPHAS